VPEPLASSQFPDWQPAELVDWREWFSGWDRILELHKRSDPYQQFLTIDFSQSTEPIAMASASDLHLGGGFALTPDHDVLTDNGWVPIGDIETGERVLSFVDGRLEYHEVRGTYTNDYDTQFLVHNGRSLRFKASPEHRWLVELRDGRGWSSGWHYQRSTELYPSLRIPATGTPSFDLTDEFCGDELELIGWWIAEGAGKHGRRIILSQYNEAGRQQLVGLARRRHLAHNVNADSVAIEYTPPDCGNRAYNKFIPRKLFFERERHRLLEGLVAGDGESRRDGWNYYTTSEQLADDVQELAIGLGYRAMKQTKTQPETFISPTNGQRYRNRPQWRVSIYPRKTHSLTTTPGVMRWEHYSGPAVCLWVPTSGNFMARYRGTAFFTGNTDHPAIRETMELVLATDRLHIGLAGDTIEGFIPGVKPAETVEQQIAPVKAQLKALESLTDELVANDKLWFMSWGDHDSKWFEQTVGFSIVKHMLDSKVPYFVGRATIKLLVGEQEYWLLVNHSERFASQWNPLHPQRRAYERFFPADVVIAGHKHKPAFQMFTHYDGLREMGIPIGGRGYLVANGTFKTGPDPYTIRSWERGVLGVPTLVFSPDGHDVTCFDSPAKAAKWLSKI
jgi:hypothetical protein